MSHLSFQTNLGTEPPVNLAFVSTFPTLAGWCQYAATLSDPSAALQELLQFLQHPSFTVQRHTHPAKVRAIAVQGSPITPLIVVGNTATLPVPELHKFQTQILIEQLYQPPVWLPAKHAKGLSIVQKPECPPIALPNWLTPSLLIFEQSKTLPIFSADTSFFSIAVPLSDAQLQRASGGTSVFQTALTPQSENPLVTLRAAILYETGVQHKPFVLMLDLCAPAGRPKNSTKAQLFQFDFTGRADTLAEIGLLMEVALQRFVLCYQQYTGLQLWLNQYQQEIVHSSGGRWDHPDAPLKLMWSMDRACSATNTDTKEAVDAAGVDPENYSQPFTPAQLAPIFDFMLPMVHKIQHLTLTC